MTPDFRLLIFIVAYNAENHIEGVLDNIPPGVWDQQLCRCDVLVIDDASVDRTYQLCNDYAKRTGKTLTIMYNQQNQGYGGNQKLGYRYAITHGYDAVVLLHGDGQYNPSLIPKLSQPVIDGSADVVIGSRMIDKKAALKGGMPFYKFVANIILSFVQNKILGAHLSEFHSGYRIYRVSSLRGIPFEANSNYFDFDTDILIQLLDTRQRIHEIAIPTFYGDEICHVNGMKYAAKILISTVLSKLQRHGLCHVKKFDYTSSADDSTS